MLLRLRGGQVGVEYSAFEQARHFVKDASFLSRIRVLNTAANSLEENEYE
jgi:hypothetical protein